MACKIETGISNTCDELNQVGGADQTFWVGYHSELDTPISDAQTADLSQIDFGSYGGLRRFDGNKFAHSFGDELAVVAGGNKFYNHTAVVKLLSNSTADDVTLQTLELGTDIFIVAQTNNNEFKIYGATKGLSATAGTQNTGTTADSDVTDTITLSGAEKKKALRFALPGGYAATLARIEGYEI